MRRLYQLKSVAVSTMVLSFLLVLGLFSFTQTTYAYDLNTSGPCDAFNCGIGCSDWIDQQLPGACTTSTASCSGANTCACNCADPAFNIECTIDQHCSSSEVCDTSGNIAPNTTPYKCVPDPTPPDQCVFGNNATCEDNCDYGGTCNANNTCTCNPPECIYGSNATCAEECPGIGGTCGTDFTCTCGVCVVGNNATCDGWCPDYGGQCTGGSCNCYDDCEPGDPSTCDSCPGNVTANCTTTGDCICPPTTTNDCSIDSASMQVCNSLLDDYGQGFTEDPACNGCGPWVGCVYGSQCSFLYSIPGFVCSPNSIACPSGATVIPPGEQCEPDDEASWTASCAGFCGSDNVLGCEGAGTCVCISSVNSVCGTQGCDYGRWPGGGSGYIPGLPNYGDVGELLGIARDVLIPAGIVASLFLIASCGYTVMTSQGDPRKLMEAKECISSAVTGVVFILLAVTVLNLLINSIIK